MAPTLQISVEEYLRTSFPDGDRDYLDGEVLERNVGSIRHSKVQREIVELFGGLRQKLPLFAFPELRVRIAPRRFRILDVAIYADHEPADEVPSEPPLIAIEIVSREDRYTDLLEKLEEYRQWGAAHVWLLDPWLRKASVYRSGSLEEADVLPIPEQGVEIRAVALFG